MKTSENYTTSALFFVGFFGIFVLMFFQPSIAGTDIKVNNEYEDYQSYQTDEEPKIDSTHWRKRF